jgi:hypothetical protein
MKTILISILLMSIIVFSQCDSNLPIIGKKKKEDPVGNLFALCFQLELGSNYNKSNRIQDNGDGTISLVEVIAGGTCQFSAFGRAFGRHEGVTPRYTIKKCIQGQVYRQAQNDCKGTGTAANYWGAQKLQACPTNDTACDDSIGKQSKTLSPARASCINDKTAGQSWDNEYSFSVGKEYNLSKYLSNRADELPVSDTDYYWSFGFGAGNIYGGGVGAQSKDTSNYVMCFRKG